MPIPSTGGTPGGTIRLRKCAQCGIEGIPENEDFCSDECAWTYDEILQIMRQEGHYDDAETS